MNRKKEQCIQLVIADDHALVREGIKKLFENKFGDKVEIVDEASNTDELMNLLTNNDIPDLLILDINMPGKSGLIALKEIRQLFRNLPVLILSMYPAEQFALKCMKYGAAGYITKAGITNEIIEAVDSIINRKKKYLSPLVAEKIANQMLGDHLDI
jgi:two-component system, NarL family, invasion response regulator UvrY